MPSRASKSRRQDARAGFWVDVRVGVSCQSPSGSWRRGDFKTKEAGGEDAGYEVKVPFEPGRGDATAEQTEVESAPFVESTHPDAKIRGSMERSGAEASQPRLGQNLGRRVTQESLVTSERHGMVSTTRLVAAGSA
jgi:hypothetical protein